MKVRQYCVNVYAPALVISLAGPEKINSGDVISYTIQGHNQGEGYASDVFVQDLLADVTEFVSASSGGIYDPAKRTVTWAVGVLEPGSLLTPGSYCDMTVSLRVVNNTPLGYNLYNHVRINTSTPHPVMGIPDAYYRTAVNGSLLRVTMTAAAWIPAGEAIDYSLYYFNKGYFNASNVTIRDVVPAETEFVSASDGGLYDPVNMTVTWDLGTLTPGAAGSRKLSLRILDNTRGATSSATTFR